MKFQRTIGPLGLLFVGIGSVIGSGWLFGPMYVAQLAGPAAVLAWIIGGILMIIIALTFAELGSVFPVAGGMVQFAQFSQGPLISFMTGWMVWISSVAVAPVETMGILQYISDFFPGLVKYAQNVPVLSTQGILAAAAIMFLMCILNFYGARFFSHCNNVITVIKLVIPIVTIIILLAIAFHPHNFFKPEIGGFTPYGWQGILSALPLGGVIYSFVGSNTILQLAGETKNPQLSIPIALIGSMLFCIILYALLQIAFIGALTPAALSAGWAKLHYAGDSGPFAGILAGLGIAWFTVFLYVGALISPFGTGFVFTTATARVVYGLSEIGFFPKALQKLTKNGAPIRAILLNFFVGLLLFMPFPAWREMVNFIISCFILSYIIGPIALITLRKTRSDLHRPFRLPYATPFALLAFYICNLLIFWTGWETLSRMMLALSIGFLFFVIHCYRQKNNLWVHQLNTSWWIFPYLIGMAVLSYLGIFGHGKQILTFGIDFIAVGILSIMIFFIALNCSEKMNHMTNESDLS